MVCPKKLKILWKKGIEYAKDCGAEIIDISLPNTELCFTNLLYSCSSRSFIKFSKI